MSCEVDFNCFICEAEKREELLCPSSGLHMVKWKRDEELLCRGDYFWNFRVSN